MGDFELEKLNTVNYESEEIINAIQQLKKGTIKKGQIAPNSWVIQNHYDVKPNMTNSAKIKSWAKAKLALVKVTNGSITFRDSAKSVVVNAGLSMTGWLVNKVPFIGKPLAFLNSKLKEWAVGKLQDDEWEKYKGMIIDAKRHNTSDLALATTYVSCHVSNSIKNTIESMSANLNMLISEQAGLYDVASEIMKEAMMKQDQALLKEAYQDIVACGQREYVLINDIRQDYDHILTLAATLKEVIDICTIKCNENQDALKAHDVYFQVNAQESLVSFD